MNVRILKVQYVKDSDCTNIFYKINNAEYLYSFKGGLDKEIYKTEYSIIEFLKLKGEIKP